MCIAYFKKLLPKQENKKKERELQKRLDEEFKKFDDTIKFFKAQK